MQDELKPGEDYYLNEQGLLVFTAGYHLRRGYCCRNGCRHCPYGFSKTKANPTAGQQEEGDSPQEDADAAHVC